MKFVVVVKVVRDFQKVPGLYKGLPPEYPVDCREFSSRESAALAFPGKHIFTEDEYWGYSKGMAMIFNHMGGKDKKTLWQKLKFWGK